jgi:hypothetical protein
MDVGGRLRADRDVRDEEAASELEPEGGPMVLRTRRVEVGKVEESSAKLGLARHVGCPALLGGRVEALDRLGPGGGGVLKSELAEAASVVLDLHPEARSRSSPKALRQAEVQIVRGLAGGETGSAIPVDDTPDAVASRRHLQRAVWAVGLDPDLEVPREEETGETSAEMGQEGVHRSAGA